MPTRSRRPRRQRPPLRARLVEAPVSSMKTSFLGLVAGLRLSGLVAQKAFDKPMKAATFEEGVEKCLVPTLSKGDIVVMDNLSEPQGAKGRATHRGGGSRVAISAALQSRHEPHRKSLFETQILPAQNLRAHDRRPDERPRNLRPHLQTCRVRELLQGLRIRYAMIGVRSKRPRGSLSCPATKTALLNNVKCNRRLNVADMGKDAGDIGSV